MPFFLLCSSARIFFRQCSGGTRLLYQVPYNHHSGYRNALTPLQLASYDVHFLKMVVNKDQHALLDILTCGISPTPATNSGVILHRVCKFGQDKLLKIFWTALISK
jgi:hypothetical protein